mgnify:CR=1 FL=1
MQDVNRVQEILKIIRGKQDEFNVSSNEELTEKLATLINKVDWDDLWINNISQVKAEENNLAILEYELDQLYVKKDINSLLPENTRFRFAKKLIRRLMYTITRDQEEYNREVFRAINEIKSVNKALSANVIRLQIELEQKDKDIIALNKKIDCLRNEG